MTWDHSTSLDQALGLIEDVSGLLLRIFEAGFSRKNGFKGETLKGLFSNHHPIHLFPSTNFDIDQFSFGIGSLSSFEYRDL